MSESTFLMFLYGSAVGLLLGILALLFGRQEHVPTAVIMTCQPQPEPTSSGCGGVLSIVAFVLLGVLFLMMVI